MTDAAAAPPPPAPAPGGAVGTVRNPVTTWLLVIITFGIYGLYWWYKINEEVAAADPTIEVNPVLSVLALFVPIANLVTIYRTGQRIGQAQTSRGVGNPPASGWIGILLGFVLGLYVVYYQSNLNRIWNPPAA